MVLWYYLEFKLPWLLCMLTVNLRYVPTFFLIYLGLHAVIGWMVTYPLVLETLTLLYSGLQSRTWKIYWPMKSCKFNYWCSSNLLIICLGLVIKYRYINFFFFGCLVSRCCIYRLPKAHKHITRPPAGVTFPPKVCSSCSLLNGGCSFFNSF